MKKRIFGCIGLVLLFGSLGADGYNRCIDKCYQKYSSCVQNRCYKFPISLLGAATAICESRCATDAGICKIDCPFNYPSHGGTLWWVRGPYWR